jgi:hypothetical protein
MNAVLPEDIYNLILDQLDGDLEALAATARVSREFHRLALPFLYKRMNMGALHTLLARPELAALVHSADISWSEYDPSWYEDVDEPSPRGYGMDRPIGLTVAQAQAWGVSAGVRRALVGALLPNSGADLGTAYNILEICMPARTVLLLRMCPHLTEVDAEWWVEAWFFSTQFPLAVQPAGARLCAQGLTSLRLVCSPTQGQGGFLSASEVAQLMLLPHLQRLSVQLIWDYWSRPSDEEDRAMPALYGRSGVEHLALTDCFIRSPVVFRELLRLPRALASFAYEHNALGAFDLAALGAALADSPSRASLRHVAVTQQDGPNGDIPAIGDLRRLAELPALASAHVQARCVIPAIGDDLALARMIELLPWASTLRVSRLLDACPAEFAVKVVCKVIETYAGRPLRVLVLDGHEFTEGALVVIRELGEKVGVVVETIGDSAPDEEDSCPEEEDAALDSKPPDEE